MRHSLQCVKKRIAQKLRSSSGESFAELLIALLIASMATVALLAMTLSASSNAAKTRTAYENVCDQETAIALTVPDSAGSSGEVTAQIGSGTLTVTIGSAVQSLVTQEFTTDDFTYYEVSSASKVLSSEVLQASSGDGGNAGGGA